MSTQDKDKPIRGFIFACTKKTEEECLNSLLFGCDKVYAPVAIRVRKGDILFLHKLDTHSVYGVFRAISNGGLNIQPEIWNGKYPYQIKAELIGKLTMLQDLILTKFGITQNTPIIGEKLVSVIDAFATNSELNNTELYNTLHLVKEQNNDVESEREIPLIEATTLWDFPRQNYGTTKKGDNKYSGVTPALVIFNLIWRYTEIGELVVDPMCGSGTTIDVCKEEKREALGFDICPPASRKDEIQSDARSIPLIDGCADMVFIDSPYGDNIKYNEKLGCLCNISSEKEEFYDELEKIMIESNRILKEGKIIAWLIGDQWLKKEFTPVGLKVYDRIKNHFVPIEIICVTRRGQSSNTRIWYNRARRNNFFLRGFKYLIIAKKVSEKK
jgi:DNA modification methylase